MRSWPAGPDEHGIAAEWLDVFECYCGALVGKDPRNDIDHFTIHGVTRP